MSGEVERERKWRAAKAASSVICREMIENIRLPYIDELNLLWQNLLNVRHQQAVAFVDRAYIYQK